METSSSTKKPYICRVKIALPPLADLLEKQDSPLRSEKKPSCDYPAQIACLELMVEVFLGGGAAAAAAVVLVLVTRRRRHHR